MSATATRAPLRTPERGAAPGQLRDRLFEPGSVTLEEAILAVWQDLVTEGRAECPVCGGSISVEGGCPACGSELS